MTDWNIKKAQALYNVERWSDGYFDINKDGHISVIAGDKDTPTIDLYEVSQEIRQKGLSLPVLVRITHILSDRVEKLFSAFSAALKKHEYAADYIPVYPIKVNQQRTVVEHIIQDNLERIGLEAGSKPELMAVLAHANQNGGVIVCNGYKDSEYIRLALIGQKLGHNVFIVIEKLSEVSVILNEAKNLDVNPLLGLRVRLSSIGKGKWQNSGGEKSKFGLSADQVLQIIHQLKSENALQHLRLLHCHLGSQLANIRDIQNGLREFARYFSELTKFGANITHVDVGGGLGIDYEGSRSRNYCSMNYSINEYANDVVDAFWQICKEENIKHPHIISESGRAMTAHHAVMITNIIDSETPQSSTNLEPTSASDPIVIQNLWNTLENISDRPEIEIYHDAVHWLAETQSMYTHGILNLNQRAKAEQIYFKICFKLSESLSPTSKSHREIIDELNDKLAYKYFVNLSIFQSLPDVWAIDQVFPITPLHRLDEKPTCRVTLQDVTCDSDGAIKHYVNYDCLESTLPMHELKNSEDYLIGIFLVGAYQEILGDMHNLFGDTHSINLEINKEGKYKLLGPELGDSVEEILSYVHFDTKNMLRSYQSKIDNCAFNTSIQKQMMEELKAGLTGYSYLED